jgi:GAF domain-containing protein
VSPDRSPSLPLTDELSAVFARMSGLLLSRETVGTALELVTALAVDTVPGSSGAGVTVVDEAGRRTSAATDPWVERADGFQYDLDEGPCLAATAGRQVVRVDDVATDPRWPRWGAAAAGLGLRSSLSAPMVAGDRTLGAVKVYADRPAAFDPQGERRLSMFAGQAAILVANVATYERTQRLSAELRDAVRSRDFVNMATGFLMARHRVDRDVAFGLLLARSRQDGATLSETAAVVVGSAVRRGR